MKKWFGLVIVLFTFYLSRAVAEGLVPVLDPALGSAAESISAQYQDRVVNYLNELSGRRRLTTVFPNEQSPFYGVQMNYVNVHRGNLTFAIRDLVRLDGIPIVFGRIYDSSKFDESDFGPGWKLSVSESIARVENYLVYTDANNSHYQLDVAGNQIRSQHRHLTGISSGHIDGNRVQLLSNGLTKIFQRNGDTFRLVEVQDSNGNAVSLEYEAGVVVRIHSSSGRFVNIRRDARGRVEGAQDDAGRTVRYGYDELGLLSEVVDLAGGSWSMGYDDKGRLREIRDPREILNIAAIHDADGRATQVDIQHDSMTFEYAHSTTTVRNAMQQAAVFWHHATGLTSAVQDFAGTLNELSIDDDLRVRGLRLDGADVARIKYEGNRLTSVQRIVDGVMTTSNLRYDARGRVVSIADDDGFVARYAYNANGDVTLVADSDGWRHYRYDRAGRINGVSINDDVTVAIRTDEFGRVTGISWADGEFARTPYDDGFVAGDANGANRAPDLDCLSRYGHDRAGCVDGVSIEDTDEVGHVAAFSWSDGKSARIRYNTKDLVEDVEIRRGDRIYRHRYEYDARGLRTNARYSPGENLSLSISIDYDEVGNAIQLNRPTPDGGMISDRYVIGAQNQILSASAGRVRPEMAFEYDAAGRLTRSTAGNREAEFVYDELGRLADVYLDDRHMITSDYDPMDLDPVLDADDRTDFTPINLPVSSSIYGSQESIAHTRPIGSPFGAVRFVPSMARFVIRDTIVPRPDSVLFSSLQHRILISRGGIEPTPMLGFDKASNSLFIPRELFSANCFICWDWVSGFGLSRVGSGPITPGQQVTFQADGSASECWTTYIDDDLDHELNFPGRFIHNVDYDDGNASTLGGPWGYYNHEDLQFTHSYSSPGVYTVVDNVECSCSTGFFLAQASEQIEVCETSNVTPYSPDPEPLDIGSLTQATQTALTCLQSAVSEAGATLYVISGYRSQSYQDHLLEVWVKYQIVKDWPSDQCSEVRDNVQNEWDRHGLAYEPAEISPHTAGNAFDASWTTLPQNVSIDTLAASCNLSRPLISDDPYHFVYSN